MLCIFESQPNSQVAWTGAFPRAVALFERVFVSSELGLRKPELAAFEAVSTETNIKPAGTVFFDDTLENVEAAQEAGFQAVHVQTPADVKKALGEIKAL